MEFWQRFQCIWIATVDQSGGFGKVRAVIRAALQTLRTLPGSSLVHVHVAPHHSFYRKSLFIWLARLFGKPVIIHIHAGDFGDFWSSGGVPRRTFVSATVRSARLVLAVSRLLAEDLQRCCDALPVMVMPNPFDMPPVRRGQLPSVRTILFAGRNEREKGVFDLIEAFREIHRVLPDVRLILAGDGKTAEAESMVRQLRLSDCVEFPGWLGENTLAERYSQASVFCLPSYIEGMPIAVLQSMAAGVPVVASAVGGICDVLQAGAGLTVAPGDVEDLARQLIRVLIDPDLQRRLAAAGREALCAYKADSVNKRIESVYQDLLTGTAKPHPAFHGV